MTIQERLNAITDISLCIEKYLQGKDTSSTDSWNPAGFLSAEKFQSGFGWNFQNVLKPSIDDLETAQVLVEQEVSDQAIDQQARSTKDLEFETTLIGCVQTALNGVEDLEPLVSPTNPESIARLNALSNRQNKIINCLIAIIKKYIAPKLSLEDL